jgi:hypothetical protein
MCAALASTLREIGGLDVEQLQDFVAKFVRCFPELDIEGLPPVIYQLLVLCSKTGKAVGRLLLRSTVGYFRQLDEKSAALDVSDSLSQQDSIRDSVLDTEQLRGIEGTVILQINFAVKHDQKMGKECIKMLTADAAARTPFGLALLFSLARISWLEDSAFKLAKGAVSECCGDRKRRQVSGWARSLGEAASGDAIDEAILQTARNSATGWDHITQSLVAFGFVLLDSTSGFGAVGRPSGSILEPSGPGSPPRLGGEILMLLFESHDLVRSAILEECLTRIVTGAGSIGRAVSLLGKLVLEQPHAMLDHLQQIKELFDYVSALPPSIATDLLRAVGPLLGLRADLHEYVVLAFRKAVFSKDAGARSAAVRGFVELVKLGAARPGGGNRGSDLQMQVFGLFRRCLSQQAAVRECVYAGLAEVYTSVPAAQPAILELLEAQLSVYYEDVDDDAPPLRLEKCLTRCRGAAGGVPAVEEPLPLLLFCAARCAAAAAAIAQAAAAGAGDETQDVMGHGEEHGGPGGGICGQARRLAGTLELLVTRLVEHGLEGFELEPPPHGSDSEAPAAAARRLLKLGVLKDVCEAAMELSVMAPAKAGTTQHGAPREHMNAITFKLFAVYQQAALASKPGSKGGGKASKKRKAAGSKVAADGAAAGAASGSGGSGGGGRRAAPEAGSSHRRLQYLTTCLEVLAGDRLDEMSPKSRAESLDFRRYIYGRVSSLLSGPSAAGCGLAALKPLAATLTKAVQAHRVEDLASSADDEDLAAAAGGKKAAAGGKERPAVAALKCLQQLVAAATKAAQASDPTKVSAALAGLLAPTATVLNVQQQAGQAQVSAAFGGLLTLEESLVADTSWREAEVLCGLLAALAPHLEPGSAAVLAARLEKNVRQMPRPNGQFSKAACKLLLVLDSDSGGLKVPLAMAADIKSALGVWQDADDDVPGGVPSYAKLIDQVRKTPSWSRSWANFSLLSLCSHRSCMGQPAWANLTPFSSRTPRWQSRRCFSQPLTLRATKPAGRSRSYRRGWLRTPGCGRRRRRTRQVGRACRLRARPPPPPPPPVAAAAATLPGSRRGSSAALSGWWSCWRTWRVHTSRAGRCSSRRSRRAASCTGC